MNRSNLLVELLVEELPPKALALLGERFAQGLVEGLAARGLCRADTAHTPFATPRRLAVHVRDVLARAPVHSVEEKLMPRTVAFDEAGRPTEALRKRLARAGREDLWAHLATRSDQGFPVVLGPHRLEVRGEGKTAHVLLVSEAAGIELAEGLEQVLEETLARLPTPKLMSYQLEDGWTTVHFVRPAHGLVALFGGDIVPVEVLGLTSGRVTRGHRFQAAVDPIVIEHADDYEALLARDGRVIASFAARRAEIARQIDELAARLGLVPLADDALLDEVTALVEHPRVLVGQFDEAFLAVPPECLVLTMKANQKYFPLFDGEGRLTNRFLLVANVSPEDTRAVVAGNERVIRPRLADARFFFEQDRRQSLASRVPRLGEVVYHHRLGSQLERVGRIGKLAVEIARAIGAPVAWVERAAHLAKADLVTDMVGEFPELQGVMGRYYALHDGEPEAVARAIEEHYRPRFSGDALPEGDVGMALALADKLETLVGMFGIGAKPSGEKDPYGLRRAALGVLRILAERRLPLDLDHLLAAARATFGERVADSVQVDVRAFCLERLRGYLRERGHAPENVEAVLAVDGARVDRVLPRLQAVAAFLALPEAASLASAHKRIHNILKKATGLPGEVDPGAFVEAAERALFDTLRALEPEVRVRLDHEDYRGALLLLARLKAPVDRFFDEVMVMAEDPRLRDNRLALAARLEKLMNAVADIARLAA